MIFTASLNTKQFSAFLAAMHTQYPEFRYATGDIPIYRAQIAKNATHVQIKALNGYTLPPDVEETAVRLLADVLADKTLIEDGEFNYSEISRRAAREERLEALKGLQTKRHRQVA